MELFDTYFVWFGQVLAVSGEKTLVISHRCVGGKITTVSRFFSEHLLQDENKHQIMNVHTKWNYLIPFFFLDWSSSSFLRMHTIPCIGLERGGGAN